MPARDRLDQRRITFWAVVRLGSSGQHQLGCDTPPPEGNGCLELEQSIGSDLRHWRRDGFAQYRTTPHPEGEPVIVDNDLLDQLSDDRGLLPRCAAERC